MSCLLRSEYRASGAVAGISYSQYSDLTVICGPSVIDQEDQNAAVNPPSRDQ